MALQSSISRVCNRSALLARPSMAALCLGALFAASPAFAQQQAGPAADTAATGGANAPANSSTAANGEDTIVVTGIRASLDSSARV